MGLDGVPNDEFHTHPPLYQQSIDVDRAAFLHSRCGFIKAMYNVRCIGWKM